MAPDAFPETRWSLILRLRDCSDPERRLETLHEVCGLYWQPLYACLRKGGLDRDDALECLHDFILHLSGSALLVRADAAKGRLRSFLLLALRQHRIDAIRHKSRVKRGGGKAPVPLDAIGGEDAHLATMDPALTPEQAFDLRWAQALLSRAWERLHAEHVDHPAFAALAPALAAPPGVPLAQLAEPAGLSAEAASAALYRWRRRLRDLVIEEISQTVGGREELDDELRHFLHLVAP